MLAPVLEQLKKAEGYIMASEQELKDMITGLGSSLSETSTQVDAISKAVDAIIAKLGTSGNVPNEDMQALAAIKTALDTSNASLKAVTDKATAASA